MFYMFKNLAAKRIRKAVEQGKFVPGLTKEQVINALMDTKTPNGIELFGLLGTRLFRQGDLLWDYGLQGYNLVTVDFTEYLVDALQDSTNGTMDAFSFHASGTDGTAESNTDSSLITEVESRTDGTQTEGASANIYQTVGTISYSASYNISEHGIFTASSGGTLLDRTVLGTSIDVTSGDEIEFTYELTVNAET